MIAALAVLCLLCALALLWHSTRSRWASGGALAGVLLLWSAGCILLGAAIRATIAP